MGSEGQHARTLAASALLITYWTNSGVVAVLMANVVIGLYVVSAWREDDEPEEAAPPVGRWSKAKGE